MKTPFKMTKTQKIVLANATGTAKVELRKAFKDSHHNKVIVSNSKAK